MTSRSWVARARSMVRGPQAQAHRRGLSAARCPHNMLEHFLRQNAWSMNDILRRRHCSSMATLRSAVANSDAALSARSKEGGGGRGRILQWLRDNGVSSQFIAKLNPLAQNRMTIEHCERTLRCFPDAFNRIVTLDRCINSSAAEWEETVHRHEELRADLRAQQSDSYWPFLLSKADVYERGLRRRKELSISNKAEGRDSYWAFLSAPDDVYDRALARRHALAADIRADCTGSYWSFLSAPEEVYQRALHRRRELHADVRADFSDSYWSFLSVEEGTYQRALRRRREIATGVRAERKSSYWSFLCADEDVYQRALARRRQLNVLPRADGRDSYWFFLTAPEDVFQRAMTRRKELNADVRADAAGSYWSFLSVDEDVYRRAILRREALKADTSADVADSYWSMLRCDDKIFDNVMKNFIPVTRGQRLDAFWVNCKADYFNTVDVDKMEDYTGDHNFWISHRKLNEAQWKEFTRTLLHCKDIKPLTARILNAGAENSTDVSNPTNSDS